MRLSYLINPRRIAFLLGGLAIYFAAQSLLSEYLSERVLDSTYHHTLIMAIDLFSVNLEKAVPTWYAVLLLFMASVLLAFIATAKRASRDRWTPYWVGLTAVFIYLSMDEGAMIHEIIAGDLQSSLDLSGVLTFGWQLVYLPLTIVVGLIFLRFFFHLPRRTQYYFALAALLYVGGALVIEGISANQYFIDDGVSFTYLVIATVEELCEMLGVVVFITGLLNYIESQHYTLAVLTRAEGSAAGLSEPRIPLRWLAGLAAFVIAANLLIVAWSFEQAAQVAHLTDGIDASDDTDHDSVGDEEDSYDAAALIDRMAADQVVVTRLVGRFGPDNAAALDVTRALHELYASVMVVVLMPSGTSYALAADALPYDRDQLTDSLTTSGVAHFILFDPAAVAAIIR